MLNDDQRAELRDEIAGTTIGSGYYQTAVATDEADQIVDYIAPLIESWLAEVKASEAYAAKEAWEETHTLKDDQ